MKDLSGRPSRPSPLLARLLIAAAAAMVSAAASASPFDPPGLDRSWGRTPALSELREFSERQRAEAGAELRALSRDAERDVQESWLLRQGSAAGLERYRRRVEAEDALDALADHRALDRLECRSDFERFGPATRRLLERSRIELRRLERRQDREIRLRELADDVAARESGSGPQPPPPDVFAPAP